MPSRVCARLKAECIVPPVAVVAISVLCSVRFVRGVVFVLVVNYTISCLMSYFQLKRT